MNENATMTNDVIEELSNRYLLFRIDEAYYGLSLTSVREIIQVPKITDIPGTPGYVKGIINLRGGVVPVIDVRLKFAMPEREYDSQTCIVVVDVHYSGSSLYGSIEALGQQVLAYLRHYKFLVLRSHY